MIGNTQLVPVKPQEKDSDEIILRKKKNDIVRLDRRQELTINGKKYEVDPRQLIRMIKNITQTIGEYKKSNNPAAHYVIAGLRKIRSDIAADLENTFNIHFQIEDGQSIFSV